MMSNMVKSSLFAISLFLSFNGFAVADEGTKSFSEIQKRVDSFSINQDDCKMRFLTDLSTRLLDLNMTRKIDYKTYRAYSNKISSQKQSCRQAAKEKKIKGIWE